MSASGFDVPDESLLEIGYSAKRLESQLEQHLQSDGGVTPEFSRKLLTTKFADWKYEDEVRMFVKPDECHEEGGLHFLPFGASLQPKLVVLGARSSVTEREARLVIRAAGYKLPVTPARLAFNTFRIIAKRKPLLPVRRLPIHALR